MGVERVTERGPARPDPTTAPGPAGPAEPLAGGTAPWPGCGLPTLPPAGLPLAPLASALILDWFAVTLPRDRIANGSVRIDVAADPNAGDTAPKSNTATPLLITPVSPNSPLIVWTVNVAG